MIASLPKYFIFKSPIGELLLVAGPMALTGVYFVGQKHVPPTSRGWNRNSKHPILEKAAEQLRDYFGGKRVSFTIPLSLTGTDFQKNIWMQIARIPYGETISYCELATRAGSPEATRAAGTSTGKNPLSIIVPCHRVLGKNGALRGFAGGLEKKRYLLEHEKKAIREW